MPEEIQDAPLTPHFPQHFFATPSSTFDSSQVKPHACMTDVVQRGNYIHCNTGSHGMRLPQGKILVKDPQGVFHLIDMTIRQSPDIQSPKVVKRKRK